MEQQIQHFSQYSLRRSTPQLTHLTCTTIYPKIYRIILEKYSSESFQSASFRSIAPNLAHLARAQFPSIFDTLWGQYFQSAFFRRPPPSPTHLTCSVQHISNNIRDNISKNIRDIILNITSNYNQHHLDDPLWLTLHQSCFIFSFPAQYLQLKVNGTTRSLAYYSAIASIMLLSTNSVVGNSAAVCRDNKQ